MYCIMLLVHFSSLIVVPLLVFLSWVELGDEFVNEKPVEYCRGTVTADVLGLGLSRGASATRKLEGVMRDKEHEGLYWFGPLR